MTRDVWTEINSRPNRIKRPFGSSLDPTTNGRIVSPMLIEEPTLMFTRKELRKAIDGGTK